MPNSCEDIMQQEIIEKYPRSREYLISILQAVQEKNGYVSKQSIYRIADYLELPESKIPALADEQAVQWIEFPLPRMDVVNNSNRVITQADVVQAAAYNLDGTGVTVMVYDGGTAFAEHEDFGGRLAVRDASGLSYHSTHVAGIIGGDGSVSDGFYRGMAPGVQIQSYGFEYDGAGTFLYTNPGDIESDYDEAINIHGAQIANNSIGTNISANGFPCEWEGDYGITSMLIDAMVEGSLGETEALSLGKRGLPVVVVNPCAPVGPRDIKPSSTGRRIVDYLRGKTPSFVPGGINFVAVEDVARGHILAAERGIIGHRYILGNLQGNLLRPDFIELMHRASGVAPPGAGKSGILSRAGRVLRRSLRSRRGQPVTGSSRPEALTCDPSRAVRELGLPQTSLDVAFARAIDWFRTNGYA